MRNISLTVLASLAAVALAACAGAVSSSVSDDESALATDPSAVDAGAPSDAGAADARTDGGAVVTFADIAPILATQCSGCHHAEFSTLATIKTERAAMISKISAGKMPKNAPDWHTTAEGIEVLGWLQTSPELQ